MPKRFSFAMIALSWLSIAVVAWFVAVPEWISLTNLSWLNAFVLGFFAILLAVQRAGRPSASIAGILYDTEHPGRSRR